MMTIDYIKRTNGEKEIIITKRCERSPYNTKTTETMKLIYRKETCFYKHNLELPPKIRTIDEITYFLNLIEEQKENIKKFIEDEQQWK